MFLRDENRADSNVNRREQGGATNNRREESGRAATESLMARLARINFGPVRANPTTTTSFDAATTAREAGEVQVIQVSHQCVALNS